MEPIEPPWQAIKEWIADAPLWPCVEQDPPPDLVIIIRRRDAAEAFPTTNRTSTGSTVPGSQPIPIRMASIKALHGNLRKSPSVTTASSFWKTPDRPAAQYLKKIRCLKQSWQGGPEGYARDQ
jgi:hypothetical protein